ncbi:hypothetical protein GSI_01432 [Ganoderma sinense ZZ0214-1]|uniref:Uncharacterized protein n=1 Tax=Ganoderma sinense ZZ0214-1 TaxID=1077348 RepID=A0A2G8SW42_9APHY|nr:hypothetical protein GSI_01432 [Ganoderma sinense ZZ0214-1]
MSHSHRPTKGRHCAAEFEDTGGKPKQFWPLVDNRLAEVRKPNLLRADIQRYLTKSGAVEQQAYTNAKLRPIQVAMGSAVMGFVADNGVSEVAEEAEVQWHGRRSNWAAFGCKTIYVFK